GGVRRLTLVRGRRRIERRHAARRAAQRTDSHHAGHHADLRHRAETRRVRLRSRTEHGGWARIAVRGAAGTTVTLTHAEMLDDSGTVYTENLRGAQQTDRYTLRGSSA